MFIYRFCFLFFPKESGDRYTSIRMRETLGEVQDSDEPDDNLTREKWSVATYQYYNIILTL